jgi:hypothetical protein
MTVGDGLALVLGGVLYDQMGIRAAYASQLVPNAIALLLLPPLALCSLHAWSDSSSTQPAAAHDAEAGAMTPLSQKNSAAIHPPPQGEPSVLALPTPGQSLVIARRASFFAASLRAARQAGRQQQQQQQQQQQLLKHAQAPVAAADALGLSAQQPI